MTGHPGISDRDIERVDPDGTRRPDRDRLVVEAPLEVRCGGQIDAHAPTLTHDRFT